MRTKVTAFQFSFFGIKYLVLYAFFYYNKMIILASLVKFFFFFRCMYASLHNSGNSTTGAFTQPELTQIFVLPRSATSAALFTYLFYLLLFTIISGSCIDATTTTTGY